MRAPNHEIVFNRFNGDAEQEKQKEKIYSETENGNQGRSENDCNSGFDVVFPLIEWI